ncbi:hypothetical protein BDY19DRAFT_903359 [Irpex rosettiformis]|uniref:Uncharacterized protein n=1 Tax=Irpex rosettiformis TaxID=378272 RepID=A0ACB8UFW1_9APHY|nr:hypothetical protein BDY19DRAFT_903359 [Irpex rosettiformis]
MQSEIHSYSPFFFSFITNSQGHIWITTSDPFDPPSIDPGYFSHSADRTILREGLKLARKLGSTPPLASDANALVEVTPGSSVQSDDDWDKWIENAYGTKFHPSCSCAMRSTNKKLFDPLTFNLLYSLHRLLCIPTVPSKPPLARRARHKYEEEPNAI